MSDEQTFQVVCPTCGVVHTTTDPQEAGGKALEHYEAHAAYVDTAPE